MKSRCKVIEVNFEELTALLERARQGPLSQEDCERLEAAIHALSRLIEKIGEKNTTISQLRALLMKPSTEKTRKVLEQAGIKTSPPQQFASPRGPEGEAETRAWTERGGGVSGHRADQSSARVAEAGRSLPEMSEGESLSDWVPWNYRATLGQADDRPC